MDHRDYEANTRNAGACGPEVGPVSSGPAVAEFDRVSSERYQADKQREAFGASRKQALNERSANFGATGYPGEELSLDNIDAAMAYQPWNEGQRQAGECVREALVMAAKAILRNVPRSPRRTLALQHLISARMDANAAISFLGRF